MKQTAAILVMLACLSAALSAQPSDVRGVVSDSLTGERIPFANVLLSGTNRGAAANNTGFFLIPNVPPGDYELYVTSVGYGRIVRTFSVQGGKPVELNIQLPPVAIETEEIVVSAESKQKLLELHSSLHVLDAADMKITPVQAQEDVLQSIKILPGIVSTSDASSKFYVRGGAGDQNLVLLDGMKIYNPYHALGIFSVFDPDIVRTTEVYTGAFPAGYGGRLSSVVSITSRDGKLNRMSGRASANFLSSKIQIEGPVISGLSFILNGRKSLTSRTFSKIVNQDAPVNFYDVFFKATSLDTSGSKLDVTFMTSADNLKFSNLRNPDYFWRNNSIGLVSSGLTGERLFVVVSGSWSRFQARLDPKLSENVTPSSTQVSEVSVRSQATYYSDAEDFYMFGFDLSFPKLEYELINSVGINRRISELTTEASSWFSVQSTFDRVQLSTGVHVEVGSLFYRRFSLAYLQPRLSLSYRVGEAWRMKLSYGLFTQNILTATNEDDILSLFDPWIHVPAELESQRSHHYVAGVDGPIAGGVWTGIQAYYKNNASLVTYNRDKVDSSDPDYVNGSGASYGVELTARATMDIVELYATYTLGVTTVVSNGFEYAPRHDRRHHVNLLGTVRPLPRLAVTLRWEFGSGFPYTQSLGYYDRLHLTESIPGPFELETGSPSILLGPKNAARLPDFHRLDIGATYNFALGPLRAEVGAHILNLYDSRNVFFFDRNTGQRVDMLPFFPSATFTLEY